MQSLRSPISFLDLHPTDPLKPSSDAHAQNTATALAVEPVPPTSEEPSPAIFRDNDPRSAPTRSSTFSINEPRVAFKPSKQSLRRRPSEDTGTAWPQHTPNVEAGRPHRHGESPGAMPSDEDEDSIYGLFHNGPPYPATRQRRPSQTEDVPRPKPPIATVISRMHDRRPDFTQRPLPPGATIIAAMSATPAMAVGASYHEELEKWRDEKERKKQQRSEASSVVSDTRAPTSSFRHARPKGRTPSVRSTDQRRRKSPSVQPSLKEGRRSITAPGRGVQQRPSFNSQKPSFNSISESVAPKSSFDTLGRGMQPKPSFGSIDQILYEHASVNSDDPPRKASTAPKPIVAKKTEVKRVRRPLGQPSVPQSKGEPSISQSKKRRGWWWRFPFIPKRFIKGRREKDGKGQSR